MNAIKCIHENKFDLANYKDIPPQLLPYDLLLKAIKKNFFQIDR